MPTYVNIAYYLKEEWHRFLEIADDRENLEDTWEEWFSGYLGLKLSLKSKGFEVQDYVIYMDELERYCKEKGLKNTGKTRSNFIVGKPGNKIL